MVRKHICKEIFMVSVSSCYSSVFVTCSIPIFLLLQLLCLLWVVSSIPIMLLFFNKMLVLREEICQQICNLVDVYLRYRSFDRLASYRNLLFYVRYGIVFCSRELALLQFLLNGTYGTVHNVQVLQEVLSMVFQVTLWVEIYNSS